MKVQLSAEVVENGPMTALALATALAGLPSGAEVKVETWDSQREGSGFRVKALWTEDR